MNLRIEDWNIESLTGYHPITTFYSDFSIANQYGPSAVEDTYNRSWEYASSDYKILTEFVMALNWQWNARADRKQTALADMYGKLFTKAQKYAEKTLKGDELEYYFETTD